MFGGMYPTHFWAVPMTGVFGSPFLPVSLNSVPITLCIYFLSQFLDLSHVFLPS